MRTSVSLLVLVLLLGILSGCSDPANKPYKSARIGVLTVGDSRADKIEGLRRGMEELGWPEPRAEYLIYNSKDHEERLAEGVSRLVVQKPDVLVVTGAVEAEAVVSGLNGKEAGGTAGMPVVFIGVSSPEELGLRERCEAAGIPVLGVDNGHVELTGKRMELARLLFPERTKILLFYDPRLRASLLALQKARETAERNSYAIEPVPIRNEEELENAQKRIYSPDESILILPSYFLEAKFREIRDLSFANKIPVLGLYETEVESGYTASYGISYYEQGYQSARLVVKALSGNAGSGVPFEPPDVVRLKLNGKAAERLGISISPPGLSFGEKIMSIKE